MNFLLALVLLLVGTTALPAQVTYERILQAEKEPGNWLTYSGTYKGHHYSTLDQIKRDNVRNLELKWVFQARSLEKFQAAPLVVDSVMYVTHATNDVAALDARTGRTFWTYHHKLPKDVSLCCGLVNRGLAMLDDLLFMGTVDASSAGPGCKERKARLGRDCSRLSRGLCSDHGSTCRERQVDCRHGRW